MEQHQKEEEEEEEWRTVHNRFGNPSSYDVSSWGRVRSNHANFANRILKGGEGPQSNSTKIRRVWVTGVIKDNNAPMRVDLLVAKEFLDPPQNGVWKVAHKNGCAWDDRLENLGWTEEHFSSLTPLTKPGDLTLEQAYSKEKAARNNLQQAVDALAGALRDVVRAEAREEAQKAAEGAGHGVG
jgi:hypothetical protein